MDVDIYLHSGAGSYECGEETALIESLEGKRGQPRLKPPFPAVSGLYNCPTVVNNVETLVCVPLILEKGADWFAAAGSEKNGGPKLYCVSGHVKRPGVYEAPMGHHPAPAISTPSRGGLPRAELRCVVPRVLHPLLTADDSDVTGLRPLGQEVHSGPAAPRH